MNLLRPPKSLVLLLLLLLGVASPAVAHPLLQNAMWVVFASDRIRVAVNVSLREIIVAQQLNPAETETADLAKLEPATAAHGQYVLSHLVVLGDDTELTGRVVNITPPIFFAAEPDQTFYQYELEYPLPAGAAPPASATFSHTMLQEWPYGPGQSWDVTYAVRLKRSDDPNFTTGLLRHGTPERFPTGFPPAAASETTEPVAVPRSSFIAYLEHGVMHILTGWDHLLFVTALVLATATFWEMFKVIAAFTLAHTITLAVSVLTGFRLPDWFIEPVIAGSIVIVAAQNFLFSQRAHGALRLGIAFGFGLVHGLGFAGGLREAMGELGTSAVLIALLAFSIGVEIGHQAVVLPVFGLLRIGDWRVGARFRGFALRYGSAAISVAGAYYLIQALTAA